MFTISILTFTLVVCQVISAASPEDQMQTIICPTKLSRTYKGLFANCRGLHLTKIPVLEGNITALDLGENQIDLNGSEFKRYPYLVYLNLEHNGLNRLPHDIFSGCGKLQFLNFQNNNLRYSLDSFPENVFDPLQKLEILNIGNNKVSSTFPDRIIKPLRSLKNLTMDTMDNFTFGEGFGNLHHLEVLCLSGKEADCGIVELYNHTFSVFNASSLQTLDLSFCEHLRKIHLDSLTYLMNLKILNLSNANHLDLTGALLGMHGLQKRNMTSIDLERVTINENFVPPVEALHDRTLTESKLQYLSTICSYELNLANNHILYINFTFIIETTLLKCLSRSTIHGNPLFGRYQFHYFLNKNMLSKSNLEYIEASNMESCSHSHRTWKSDSLYQKQNNIVRFWFLPPKLRTLVFYGEGATWNILKDVTLKFDSTNTLSSISLFNYHQLSFNGSVTGLKHLTTMKMAYVDVMTLSETCFNTFPRLEDLTLKHVSLPKHYFCKTSTKLFEKLDNMKKLDLSDNDLCCLPKDVFEHNSNLKELSLHGNSFDDILFNIEDVPHLELLDLSYNAVSSLDDNTRRSLDKHATNQRNNSDFTLNVKGNPFNCRCNNIDFVLWFKQTTYISTPNDTYCMTEHGSKVLFKNIDGDALWHECTGKPAFYIVSSMFALLISAALCSFLVVKHKTQIVVFFHRLFRGVSGLPRREDFRYDVFIGYADNDCDFAYMQLREILEERFHYRVYLHDRDSELGGSRAISILDGVKNSWKMVLVLSQNFVTNDWSIYTMHAVALYAASGRIPKRLVILLDRANPCEVPDTLLCIADEDTILPISRPNDDDSWDHLRRLLK